MGQVLYIPLHVGSLQAQQVQVKRQWGLVLLLFLLLFVFVVLVRKLLYGIEGKLVVSCGVLALLIENASSSVQIDAFYLYLAVKNPCKVNHCLQCIHLQHGDVLAVVYLQTVERNASLAETDGYLIHLDTSAQCLL